MDKRGISAVVATVLIILITVVSITIVWTSIIPMIRQGLVFSDLDGRISVVTSEGYTVYDAEKGVAMVQVKRDVDDGVIRGIKILFSINGNSYWSSVVAPDSGLTKVYTFNLSGYEKPESVSVA
ncbi:MAG: archaellin/type IV pilin N-terminal domain-containing protein, partial [Nanoarchaeota archaeon]|nr:archaellin/type IV pilin N-terminal domain-containing protein [Nanoarchaeota archaeon]